MPFDKSRPPAKLRGLSESKQKQWVSVFNSCWKEHEDDERCHKMAWGVVKKAHEAETEARVERIAARISSGREAATFVQEARALKLKARAAAFLQDVKDFKGSINSFLRDLEAAVSNPRALAAFPEVRDVIELSEFLKRGVLRHTFLSDADLAEKMQQVVEADVS